MLWQCPPWLVASEGSATFGDSAAGTAVAVFSPPSPPEVGAAVTAAGALHVTWLEFPSDKGMDMTLHDFGHHDVPGNIYVLCACVCVRLCNAMMHVLCTTLTVPQAHLSQYLLVPTRYPLSDKIAALSLILCSAAQDSLYLVTSLAFPILVHQEPSTDFQ